MDIDDVLKQLEEVPDEFKFVGTVTHPEPVPCSTPES
jgi:hypothetical protein